MTINRLPVKVLSYDDLRQIADDFLSEYHAELTLPIPIEDIVDLRMGINIVCQASLQYECEVDAFINNSCSTIHVDAEVYMSPNTNRYRFSLAHETAHAILHRDVLAKLAFDTMAEWKRVYTSIPSDQQVWIEWQAYSLGGLVLVPTRELRIEFEKAAHQIGERRAIESLKDINRYAIETSLAQTFGVSREVIQRRCNKDDLHDFE